MLCYRCGSHVPAGSEFCANCGQRFTAGVGSKDDGKAAPGAASETHEYQFQTGDVIAGRYRIKGIIGCGGIGEVYRAHDSEIDVDVAVKVLHRTVAAGDDDFRQFSSEIKAARKLAHQNIARVYDVDRDGDHIFYALQLLEGLTLRKIIQLRAEKDQVFSLQEVEPIFSQIIHALEHAHQFTCHGDLRPENVVILPDLLKVTDFYLITALGRKRFLDCQQSNPDGLRYLAPEIRYEWDTINTRADIYSLGVILMEMVTGEPYDGGPATPSAKNRALPRSIDRLCSRALEEDPVKRHESVTELLQELNKVIEESITGLSSSAGEPVSRKPKSQEEEFLPEGEFEELEDHEIEEITDDKDAPRAADGKGRRVSYGLESSQPPARDERPVQGMQPRIAIPVAPAARGRDDDDRPAPRSGVSSTPRRAVTSRPVPAARDEQKEPPAEQPRLPTAIVRAQKRHFTLLLVMVGVVLMVVAGGSFLIWSQMEADRKLRMAELEMQRKQIEEQRQGLENAQKELMAQLREARKAADDKKKVEEEKQTNWQLAATSAKKDTAAEPPPPPPPKQEGPTEEEKKIADIEAKLARIKEAKEQAEKKKAEIEEKKTASKADKAEKKAANDEEKKAAAEAKKAAAEAKKAEMDAKKKEDEEKRKADAETKKAEDEKKAAAKAVPSCPRGMVMVPAGKFNFGSSAGDPMKGFGEKDNTPVELSAYCVDIYEFPNKSGALPRTTVSLSGAEQACKKAGKRLCSEEEWEKACKGPGGLRYPYGNKWDPATCNSEDDQGNKKQVGPAGAAAKCRSGYGAADMSGNVSEWVSGGGFHKGGSADKPNYAVRCAAKAKSDPGKTSPTIGFRCCAGTE